MRGWLLTKGPAGVERSLGDIAPPATPAGPVHVRVRYSSLNYKDGLAMTGAPGVIRAFPMVPGIDLAGVIEDPGGSGLSVEQEVAVTGCGLGERVWGGYATEAWLQPEWVVPLPGAFSLEDAMRIGTAGFTAMQCVDTLESAGAAPSGGDVLVTGAAGGVGSIAVALLAARGFRVVASTGRLEEADYLKSLGAADLMDRAELNTPATRPMESERWNAAVDTVGGDTLAAILRTLKRGGSVAACGLAGGTALNTTVFPFILRGVRLLGVNSVDVEHKERLRIWERLAATLDAELLARMSTTIGLEEAPEYATRILAGRVRGRVVVRVG